VSTFGGLDTLFNPAKRHLDEEKLRLQSTREEVGDSSGGKRIDLDSGRVKIARGQSNDAAGDDLAGDDLAGDDLARDGLVGDDPADDPDAAAVATTVGTVRRDADADADPAQSSPVAAKRGRGRHAKAKAADKATDDQDTPAARARRRRAAKA
jgi:hypothetical protein